MDAKRSKEALVCPFHGDLEDKFKAMDKRVFVILIVCIVNALLSGGEVAARLLSNLIK